MFKSVTHSINSPTKTPTNNDRTVSLVIKANAIATRGGNNVKIPKRTELSPSGICVIIKDNTNNPIIAIAVTKPNFAL